MRSVWLYSEPRLSVDTSSNTGSSSRRLSYFCLVCSADQLKPTTRPVRPAGGTAFALVIQPSPWRSYVRYPTLSVCICTIPTATPPNNGSSSSSSAGVSPLTVSTPLSLHSLKRRRRRPRPSSSKTNRHRTGWRCLLPPTGGRHQRAPCTP